MNSFITIKNNILNKEKNLILFIFLISAFIRSTVAYFYGDNVLENEWSLLVKNLYNFNSFSILKFGDLFVPNLWMPPVYGYFLYLHSLIFGISSINCYICNENLVRAIITSQIILSSITPVLFFKILSNFFSKKLCFLGGITLGCFPLVVYGACQISSVSLYLFLLTLFFFFVLDLSKNQKSYRIILIGIIAGLLILTRRDFILIYLFSLGYLLFFFKINYKKIIKVILISSIVLSPYLIRNYMAFDKFIVHSGLGFNLWKAYSPNAKVEGYYVKSEELKNKLKNVKKDIFYRINEDKIYLQQAKIYIYEDPKKYINLFIKRVFSFYFLDLNSSQKNYYTFFHIYPNILIAFTSILGLLTCKKNNYKFNYLLLTMFSLICIYSLFALLPRYKSYLLPFQIFLSISFLEYILTRLRIKN